MEVAWKYAREEPEAVFKMLEAMATSQKGLRGVVGVLDGMDMVVSKDSEDDKGEIQDRRGGATSGQAERKWM